MDIHSAISKTKDTYANHPSIIEIKKVTKSKAAFSFKEVAEVEILKLLKNIDVKKSTGEDKLPPPPPPRLLNVLLAIYANL